eukprot:282862_1
MNHIILFLTFPLTILSQIDRSCYYSSSDQVGYTLWNWFYNGPSWATCEAQCRADVTCNTWMGRNSGGACYLSIEPTLKPIGDTCCTDHHPHLFIAATCNPTPAPTTNPTHSPTFNPTPSPTTNPTPAPTNNPTHAPTANPTLAPSISPSISPTPSPTNDPTNNPTPTPSTQP